MIRSGAGTPLVRRLNLVVIGAVLVLCIVAIVVLTLDVAERLAILAEASSDSVQWVLAQVEVELVRLQLHLERDTADLARLRELFDIFYSRIATLHDSPHFGDLRALPAFAAPLDAVDAFLARNVPLVDGPDAGLRAALPAAAEDLRGLHGGVRAMALAGVTHFAEQSDLQREGMATTLRRLAMVVSALVAALLVLLAALMRLNRLSRRQTEENRLTSARLETIVRTSADGIVVADRSGRMLEFNPAAEVMFGYSRLDLLQTDVTIPLLPPETRHAALDMIEAQLDPARRDGRTGGRLEVEVMRRDLSRFPAEVSLAAADSSGGEIIVAFVRDISDRRQAERDLIEARDRARAGERAKAEFLTVMSHEMRTPLNGLLGSSEILAATPLDTGQRDLVDVIATSGHVLLHHVNGVLDLSRAEAGAAASPEAVFDVEMLVAEVVANQRGLAEAAGTRLSMLNVGAPVGRVLGSPGQLRQIMLNLVGNAVKFTCNGTVTVEIELLPGNADVCLVEFRVIDSGIGIAADDLDRVFEDFVRLDTSYGRETGGTGLGLGITRRLVLALGGQIDVESSPGTGSRFRVLLPFAPGPAAAAATPAAAAQRRPGAVLVVDDNAINRFVLRHLLEETGAIVSEAEDGAEGVALAERAAFDLILMDISMPRMDGLEAARRIRAGTGPSRAARIVAVTAHAQHEERQRFEAAGMADCMVKPITRGGLAALIAGQEPVDAGTAAPRAPMVDAAILGDLFDQIGADPARMLVRRFLDEGDATMARLAAGLPGDRADTLQNSLPTDEARMLYHRFAGSAATFGALALADLLTRAEVSIGLDRPIPGGSDALKLLWADSRARIEALVPGLAAADTRAAE